MELASLQGLEKKEHHQLDSFTPLIAGVHSGKENGLVSRPPFGGSVGSLTASDYIKLVNIKTAKAIATLLVTLFILCHGLMHLTRDVTPCKGLLKSGIYKGELWQPWGCMMHHYSTSDVDRCLRHESFEGRITSFQFVGDNRVSGLHNELLKMLNTQERLLKMPERRERDSRRFTLSLTELPNVNQSAFDLLSNLRRSDEEVLLVLAFSPPSVVGVDEYERHLSNVTAFAEVVQTTSDLMQHRLRPIWVIEPGGYLERGLKKQFNSDVQHLLHSTPSIETWFSVSTLNSLNGFQGPLSMSNKTLRDGVNMLLNYHCNDRLRFPDATCCISSQSASLIQKLTLILLCLCSSLFLLESCYKLLVNNNNSPGQVLLRLLAYNDNGGSLSNNRREAESHEIFQVLLALAKLSLILGFTYICDRTNLLMRENKHFSMLNFWVPVLYILVLGLFFSEDALATRIMHREQLEETKGWMAMVLLIFNMSGGSASTPIDCNVSMLTGGFVFISAYQLFIDVWHNSGQVTIQQFLQTLFRLNFLSFLLCLTMGESYQSYSIAPLLSFWLTVHYAFHILPPHIDASTVDGQPVQFLLLVLKLMVLCFSISVLYISEALFMQTVFFESVFSFRLWRSLFLSSSGSIRQWWLSWRLHRYTIVHAIGLGLVLHLGRKASVVEDAQNSHALFPRNMAIMVSVVSVVGIAGFALWTIYCGGIDECYEALPYIQVVPMVSFVMLRNVVGWLRCRYSSFFAWFGPISLELMVAQNHLWMASNSNGILVLMPNYPLVNLLLTSFVFVCVCHELHSLTLVLEPFVVPDNRRQLLRNISILGITLLPLALRDWVTN